MILVIPSMRLVNGACANSIIGEQGTELLYSEYSENPLKLCGLWRRENARTLHLVDVDSFNGENSELNINAALYMSQDIDIPIQYYADFRSIAECKCLLDNGIYRVLISRLALEYPDSVRGLIAKYRSSRVSFCVVTQNNSVSFSNIGIKTDINEFAKLVKTIGGDRLVWGDTDWMDSDGLEFLEDAAQFAQSSGLKITLLNAANNPRQLWRLNELTRYGIDSVVMGKSLYENRFPCQAIWRKIEAKLEGKTEIT